MPVTVWDRTLRSLFSFTPMKHHILITLVVLTLLVSTPRAQALFGHVAAEKDRRVEAEQKLDQKEHSNEHLHIAISILSAGVVIALIIGAAAGGKTRRDA